jgi:hypothetical protein
MDTGKDHLNRRCPRLGGPVTFHYCRQCGDGGEPCWKVFDCWWEAFDIVSHMKACLAADQFERLLQARPKPKIDSLVDLIEQAKKRRVRMQ